MSQPGRMPLTDGELLLERIPAPGPDNLRAWDAADEYLLRQLAEEQVQLAGVRVLVVNDSFGALAVALARLAARVTSWNDSHHAELALLRNLQLNGLPGEAVSFLPGDTDPGGTFDLVLVKFPKSLAWLQDSLLRLRPVLAGTTRLLAGGMIKHTPRRAFELLERCIGPTTTGLGWKKARLAEAAYQADLDCPTRLPEVTVPVPGLRLVLRNQANVFSRDRLDGGARLLLEHLPRTEGPVSIGDLGCGNGVLALAAVRLNPQARLLGTDASYQAIDCARRNAEANHLVADFRVMDGFADLDSGSLDLVLCNPPFHQDRTVGDHLARGMLAEAHRALRAEGEFFLVGNRHLGYHARLTEIFGGCAVVTENSKFVVLRAVKATV
jgi:23S rRNA (guanine1835-N2)-methyltransferase